MRPSCLHPSLCFEVLRYDGRVRPFANGNEQQAPLAQVATVLYCAFTYGRCLAPKAALHRTLIIFCSQREPPRFFCCKYCVFD